ncbi:MAG: hypothetical protein ACON3Z_14285 [Bradymonadia bacterium]
MTSGFGQICRARTFVSLACISLLSCDDSGPPKCELENGLQGVCCGLAIPGGISRQGVCKQGYCTDGTVEQRHTECGLTPTDASVPMDTRNGDIAVLSEEAGVRDLGYDIGSLDAAIEACEDIVCGIRERCYGPLRMCVPRNFGRPGGTCLTTLDCQVGYCEWSAGSSRPSFGICRVSCATDEACDEGVCAMNDEVGECRRRCRGTEQCEADSFCVMSDNSNSGYCERDCRLQGCPGQGLCDEDSGHCSRSNVPCPYPCRVGESCVSGRCVRRNGSCVSDYHCNPTDTCFDGRCIRGESVHCQSVDDCAQGQRCTPIDGTRNICAVVCRNDTDCPLNRTCDLQWGACLPVGCAQDDPLEMYDVCRFSQASGHLGTCLPTLSVAASHHGGYCREGGLAMLGEGCDAQRVGRDLDSVAFRCEAGTLCWDDPDDPLVPIYPTPGQGTCRAVCRPNGQFCPVGQACARVARPNSDQDQSGYDLALCLASDCEIGVTACTPGVCEPHTLWTSMGQCRRRGAVSTGGRCVTSDDCREQDLCIEIGGDKRCVRLCRTGMTPCPTGRCYQDDAWAYGFCLDDR